MNRVDRFLKTVSLALSFLIVPVSQAGGPDYVKEVYVCGDDVFIRMQSAGWMVAQQSLLQQKRVDRILSVALALVSTGKPAGYFDEGPVISLCGANPKVLTVLSIKAD